MNYEDPIRLATPKKSGIYLVKCRKYYKIGLTNNISSRMTCLRISNPFDIDLIYYKELGCPMKIKEFEKKLHKDFNKYHHKGEWFILTQAKVDLVIKSIINYGKK